VYQKGILLFAGVAFTCDSATVGLVTPVSNTYITFATAKYIRPAPTHEAVGTQLILVVITLLKGVQEPLNVCCRMYPFLNQYVTGSEEVPICSTRYAHSCHQSDILESNPQNPI
jgi:hypothetical protein